MMTKFGFRRIAVAAALVLSLGTAGAARAATIDADLMFVVDGSGSMGNDFTDLGAGITTFVNAIRASSLIGSLRLGLVRYSLTPLLQINLTDDLNLFKGLNRGKGNFATENPLLAIDFAVTNSAISYRPDAVKSIILITDEEGNDFGTYKNAFGTGGSAVGALLQDRGFLNTIIHNPKKRGSTENYTQIALPNSALFNIADFRSDPTGFLTELAEAKTKEFIEMRTKPSVELAAVPLPAGVWLLLGGLGAFVAVSRKRA
jgi:hypothetical protein